VIRLIIQIATSILPLTLLLADLSAQSKAGAPATSPAKPPAAQSTGRGKSAAVPGNLVSAANAALQREDYTLAETKLRAELKLHPANAEALSLLGTALDGQKKFAEAAAAHQRAIAASPRSATILARYAQHQYTAGDAKAASETFQRALALDPSNRLANLQFAQSALARKDARAALSYLDHIPADQQDDPEVAAQRLIALDMAGSPQAAALFNRLSKATENNALAGSSIGWALAQAGQYEQAETFLTQAVAADPSDFHVLYDLGVVALYAGHNERARDVLQTAVRRQPQNVDALYSLAFVESKLNQPEEAIRWLAQAAQLDPNRADVQRLLAVTANELRAWQDAATAWDRYAKLAPKDDEARRERGFAYIHQGKFEAGLADLEWYAKQHPDDAMGFFELGAAQSASDPTQGIANLDKALALKPDFLAARAVRGSLYYKQGKPEAALPDLEAAARESQDSAVMDRLGQTYLALDRLPDAIRVLRQAAELPGQPMVLLHLANALAESGQTAESEALMERYRQQRPSQGPVDLVHFLSMTPEEQRADYRARVEKAVKDNPGDAAAHSRYLKLQLEENQMDLAAATARTIAGLRPGAAVLADAGRALLEARQYAAARDLLAQAVAAGSGDGQLMGMRVDLAIATFHALGNAATAGAEGLLQLDRVPDASRNADYYLARAQMLDATGKASDAMAALGLAVRAEPARAELYWQQAILLSRYRRSPEALQLLDTAEKQLSNEPSIPLTRAAVLELSGKTEDAMKVLDDVQRRWPEGTGVWVARGVIQAAHQHDDAARRALETASTRGAKSPEAWFLLADTTARSAPDRLDAAESAIEQALRLAPEDASIRDLAGRIAAARQRGTIRLQPAPALTPTRLFETRPPRDW
jgi:tetratricopeptide (TPR) repeat protein